MVKSAHSIRVGAAEIGLIAGSLVRGEDAAVYVSRSARPLDVGNFRACNLFVACKHGEYLLRRGLVVDLQGCPLALHVGRRRYRALRTPGIGSFFVIKHLNAILISSTRRSMFSTQPLDALHRSCIDINDQDLLEPERLKNES